MATERCPSCGGAVRPGDPWCTLCWTDLRPKPEPPKPPPAPVPTPVPAAVTPAAAPAAPAPGAAPGVDPLTAPLATLLAQPVAADPEAPSGAAWPCVECGSSNPLDANICGVCTAPFGGRIGRLDDPKAARRKFMLMALGGVAVFLMLLALATFGMTDTSNVSPGEPDPDTGINPAYEQVIDYSSLPQE